MSRGQTHELKYTIGDDRPHVLRITTRRKTAMKVEVDGKPLFEKCHIKWRYRLPLIGRWLRRRKDRRGIKYTWDGQIYYVSIGEEEDA